VAPAQSKRKSRKRRAAAAGSRPRPASPSAVASSRPKDGPPRRSAPSRSGAQSSDIRWQSTLGAYGERPPSLFGGVPVAEVAILVGAIAAAIGFFGHDPPALIVGLVVCTLGVVEVTAREHFSGYRSHAGLLAAIPAVGLGIALVAIIGHGSIQHGLEGPSRSSLLAVVPIFGVLFWWLRKRFRAARQARIVRPPGV
jgi:hypothetical protein